MAREHANVRLDIWNDDDFRLLTEPAQLLYIQLLTSATLNYAGVADWRPKRIAPLSAGRTAGGVEQAADELMRGLFIVVDDDTEEVLIRSYLKHDGLLQKPNVVKAMVAAFASVASPDLRGVIVHELGRLKERFPEWRAFGMPEVQGIVDRSPVDPSELVRDQFQKRSGKGLSKGSGKGSESDPSLLTTNYLLLATDSPLRASPETGAADEALDADALFDEFWAAYPVKKGKEPARKAFEKAVKSTPFEVIMRGLEQFKRDIGPVQGGKTLDGKTPKWAQGWLNDKRWQDEPDGPSLDQAWASALSSVDPCANGHRWTVDGTCANCVARRE